MRCTYVAWVPLDGKYRRCCCRAGHDMRHTYQGLSPDEGFLPFPTPRTFT